MAIYINDLMDRVTSNLRLFADDAVVYGRVSSLSDCNRIQDDLDKIASWCEEWQLSLNVEKCKVMHMNRKINPVTFEYNISSVLLDTVASIIYPDVTLQGDM